MAKAHTQVQEETQNLRQTHWILICLLFPHRYDLSVLEADDEYIEAPVQDNEDHEHLKQSIEMALVHGQHWFASLSELALHDEAHD